jgi:hypothetical protein
MSETGDCALVEVRLGGRKSEPSDSRTERDHRCTSHDPHIGVDEVCLPAFRNPLLSRWSVKKNFPTTLRSQLVKFYHKGRPYWTKVSG